MSRKSFLIWGLVIVQLSVTASAVLMYLSLVNIVDTKTVGGTLNDLKSVAVFISFGIILHLRLKTVGRRKRILALCLSFYVAAMFLGAFLFLGYVMLDALGGHDRYFDVIHQWAKLEDPKPAVSWTVKQRLDLVLCWVPGHYLYHWGLFALLWFGSLDPRTPSKNRFVQFFKTGFQRKATAAQIEVANLVLS